MPSENDPPTPWELEWNPSLSVCIPEIDAEHRHFINLVNELNAAIIGRRPQAQLEACLRAVQQDAESHFAREEALFRQWNYPEAEVHGRWHAEILQQLDNILAGAISQQLGYQWVEAGLRIKRILIEHLLYEDVKYQAFCKCSQLC